MSKFKRRRMYKRGLSPNVDYTRVCGVDLSVQASVQATVRHGAVRRVASEGQRRGQAAWVRTRLEETEVPVPDRCTDIRYRYNETQVSFQ